MGLVFVLVAGATLVPGTVIVALGARLVRRRADDVGRVDRRRGAAIGGITLVVLGAALVLVGLAAVAELVGRMV